MRVDVPPVADRISAEERKSWHRRGRANELVAAARLIELGASIAIPVGEGHGVDLVVYKPVFATVEVKTSSYAWAGRSETISANVRTSAGFRKKGGAWKFKPTADYYVVCVPLLDDAWWILPAAVVPPCGVFTPSSRKYESYRGAWGLILHER